MKEVLDRLQAAKGTEEYRVGEIFLSATRDNQPQVLTNANKILGNYGTMGSTLATNSLYRLHAEALKIVLDAVNNSNSNNPNSPGPICVSAPVISVSWHDNNGNHMIDPGEIY